MLRQRRVVYLVGFDPDKAQALAAEKGWRRIGYARYATEGNEDVRFVRRHGDLQPLAGETPMMRGADFEDGPPVEWLKEKWAVEREWFEGFVRDGNGCWVEL